MTGEDYRTIIENAGGSDTFFRLKAEKEWDEAQTLFQNDLFSLDMKGLELAMACIPLDKQIDLDKEDLNVRRKLFALKIGIFFQFYFSQF